MTELRPFAALRFARDPAPRIAPPYDVVSEEERARLAAEPENVVHLTLPPGREGERDYAGAAATLADWIGRGVLVRDPGPRLYALAERTPGGRVRRGVLGLLRLADYGTGEVLPHERTMPGPKRDRLLLTRETRANLEPLFFLYEDREGATARVFDEATRGSPLAACAGPDGTALALYALGEPGAGTLRGFLSGRPALIADGHHRYETLLRYRDEQRARGGAGPDAPHEFVLAYLVNAFDPGTELGAFHRVLEGEVADPEGILAERGFRLEPLPGPPEASSLLRRLAGVADEQHAFAFLRAGAVPLLALRPRGKRPDVEVLHEELLPALGGEVRFDAQADRVLGRLRSGEARLAVLLNPIPAEELFRVVGAGAVLPQKSTYFAPKIPSGLVIRDL